MRIALDLTGCLATRIGAGGIEPEELAQQLAAAPALAAELERERREQGRHAHMDLARIERDARTCLAHGLGLRERFHTMIQCGIGGSALGNVAAHTALPGNRNVLVIDNVDPDSFPALGAGLERTVFHIVTKSGETTETLAQFLVVVRALQERLGESWRQHLIVTTDPGRGALGELCREEGIQTLPIPPALGGRFSFMSPVGLLSLAFAGRDPVVLARGARAALQACLGERSPALAYAAVLHRFYQAGRRIAVFWPYAETLWGVALWWRQLLAESLGKRRDLDGHEIRVGPCPLPALGVSDQHSVHQLFMEGPDDKWFSFVELARFRKDVAIPELYPDRPALAYLGGKSFATLMHAERRGTQHALQQAGRPCALITVPELDEHTLGELLMMLEMAISFAGKLFHLDPYDQPGVEAGKRASWALLGREGAGEAAGIEQALAPDPAWCFPAEPGA